MKPKRRHRSRPAATPAPAASPPDSGTPSDGVGTLRATLFVMLLAAILAALAYAPVWHAGFVYDDHRQILQNPLVQQPELLGKALTSDVWAFAGGDADAGNVSNYWRPLFVAMLAAEYAAFGPSPLPWHLVNLGVHLLVCALVFGVLRRLGAPWGIAAATTWLFAALPTHVESVAWISGLPDPLCAALLLASFLAHRTATTAVRPLPYRIAACAAFAAALGTKEIAIVFPGIVLFDAVFESAPRPGRWRGAMFAALPFGGVALLYLGLRFGAIGMHHVEATHPPSWDSVLWSAPSIALFYLQHAVLPFDLGPNYPLGPIARTTAGFGNVVLPAMALVAIGALVALACRSDPLCRRLWPWFALPLLPVFDVRAFVPEDVVHDRYLYLPSFAAIAMLLSILASFAQRLWAPGPRRLSRGVAAAGAILALGAVPLAVDASRVWRDDVSLWERGIRTNPLRAFPHAQLGDAYRRDRRLTEARRELERAAELNPTLTAAQVGLGAIAREEGRYAEAVARVEPVYARAPDLAPAIEVLGMAYQAQGKLAQAMAVYERGRRDLPYQRGLYTVNLAVLQRQAGRADLAKAELESLGAELGGTRDPKVLRAWWYLAELEREAGHAEAARGYYRRYLVVTAALDDPEVRRLRALAARQSAALDPP